MSWVSRYSEFISETDPSKARSRLKVLESAMFSRLQELNRSNDGDEERLAIGAAAKILLEIKERLADVRGNPAA